MTRIQLGSVPHGQRIAAAAGTVFNPSSDRVIARLDPTGELLGGVTYTGYTGASIQIHMAGFAPNWANMTFLWMVFDYPFNQLGCGTVFGQVPETNTRALEIDQKLGFKIVAKIDGAFPDGACCVLALTREDCRWLKVKPRNFVIVQR